MLQIDHRESHDIDLFVDDPQLMPFFNAVTQDFTLPLRPNSYISDGTQSLKMVFDGIGQIDVICCGWLTDDFATTCKVNGRQILLENSSEIIAKKIFHRGGNLQPRDMFDIAAVRQVYGDEYVINALSTFPQKVGLAQGVAEKLSPESAQGVLQKFQDRARIGTTSLAP